MLFDTQWIYTKLIATQPQFVVLQSVHSIQYGLFSYEKQDYRQDHFAL